MADLLLLTSGAPDNVLLVTGDNLLLTTSTPVVPDIAGDAVGTVALLHNAAGSVSLLHEAVGSVGLLHNAVGNVRIT